MFLGKNLLEKLQGIIHLFFFSFFSFFVGGFIFLPRNFRLERDAGRIKVNWSARGMSAPLRSEVIFFLRNVYMKYRVTVVSTRISGPVGKIDVHV